MIELKQRQTILRLYRDYINKNMKDLEKKILTLKLKEEGHIKFLKQLSDEN